MRGSRVPSAALRSFELSKMPILMPGSLPLPYSTAFKRAYEGMSLNSRSGETESGRLKGTFRGSFFVIFLLFFIYLFSQND